MPRRNDLLDIFRPQWKQYHRRGQHDAHVVLWRCQYNTWHGHKNHDRHIQRRDWLMQMLAPDPDFDVINDNGDD
jgi:hypothetical protein